MLLVRLPDNLSLGCQGREQLSTQKPYSVPSLPLSLHCCPEKRSEVAVWAVAKEQNWSGPPRNCRKDSSARGRLLASPALWGQAAILHRPLRAGASQARHSLSRECWHCCLAWAQPQSCPFTSPLASASDASCCSAVRIIIFKLNLTPGCPHPNWLQIKTDDWSNLFPWIRLVISN